MAATLKLELVSPERLLVSEQVEMVLVPGTEGVFGVLPLHAPTLSTLKPGFVDIYQAGAVVQRFFVSGGFVEVTRERCTVLVDEAIPQATLTAAYAAESVWRGLGAGSRLCARKNAKKAEFAIVAAEFHGSGRGLAGP